MSDSFQGRDGPVDPEVRSTLAACCHTSRPASIITQGLSELCQGRFASLGADTVTLEIVSSPAGAVLAPKAVSCVSFHHEGRSRVFLAPIQRHEPPRLVIALPGSIAAADVRRALRVPIRAESGLTVEVDIESRTCRPRVLNLSTGGVLVQFAPADDPNLPVDAKFSVRLAAGERSVTLTGMVRRRKDHDYAIFFAEVFERRQPATSKLEEIVQAAEKTWLASRRG